jgi:hypothetical protein
MSISPEFGKETGGFPVVPAYFEPEIIHTPNHALSLTQSARTIWIYQRVEHVMSLSDGAVYAKEKLQAASNALALIQAASPTYEESEADVLSLDSIVAEFNVVGDRAPAGNVLNLSQTVFSIAASAPVEHVLGLTHEAIGVGPFKEHVTHWLALSHQLPTPFRIWIEDSLALIQSLPTPLTGNASHTLAITDEASITNIEDTLNLTHSVIGARVYEMSHTLNLVSSVGLISDFVRSVNDPIAIGHALTWFRDNACDRKNYTPFQGDQTVNTDFDPPPASLPPTPHDASTDRLVLYYPSIDAIARQLTLRAPEFQDRDRNSYTRVTRETRGGSLIVYADPEWPSLRSVAVTVQGLTANEADDYLTFMYATLGRKVQVRDWEGGLWEGVIVNPENPVTQDGPGCKYTISFELEGIKFETDNWTEEAELDGFVLNLEDEATVVKVTP